jgi:hypothetical protein
MFGGYPWPSTPAEYHERAFWGMFLVFDWCLYPPKSKNMPFFWHVLRFRRILLAPLSAKHREHALLGIFSVFDSNSALLYLLRTQNAPLWVH